MSKAKMSEKLLIFKMVLLEKLGSHENGKSHLRRSILTLTLILLFCQAMTAFNFQAPLTAVEASIDGYNVFYRVFDPSKGLWVEGNFANYGYYASNLINQDGVVAAYTGKEVHYSVYDPSRGQWIHNSFANYSYYPSNLINQDGVVAACTGEEVHYSVYDPSRGQWVHNSFANYSYYPSNLINEDGVVAACTGGEVHYSVYDPSRGQWVHSSFANYNYYASNLINQDGVVAAYTGQDVNFVVYDPLRGQWIHGYFGISGISPTSLSIKDATVSFKINNQLYTRGYDHNKWIWYDGPTMPLALFIASPVWGVNEFWVNFWDMSLGANTYSWDFDDGITSNLQSPLHAYTSLDAFNVTQHIMGPGGYDSYTKTVKTDTTPPTGSIIINSGNAKTTSTSVNLNISATDNSGTVSNMRFSNDNSTWSVWELYSPNKSWTLSPGYGIKTVYIQFEDKVGNISSSFKDTIELAPYITVIFPNGGESWLLGSIQNIKWAVCDVNNNIKILLLKNSTLVGTIAGNINPSSGSFPWAVGSLEGGNSVGIGSGYQISIVELNTNKTDISNSSFAIVYPSITVLSPNGNEIWNSGSSQIIKWKSMGLTGSIELTLWKNDVCVGTIAAAIPATAISYTWTVGKLVNSNAIWGSGYRIKIKETGTANEDFSDNPFSIAGISITSPNGNELLPLKTSKLIQWNSLGIKESLELTLWKDGNFIGIIATKLPYDTTSYNWIVGNLIKRDGFHWDTYTTTIGTGYKIKIQEIGKTNIDFSDNPFNITGIKILSPSFWGWWKLLSNRVITWKTVGDAGPITITLFKSGVLIGDIAQNLPAGTTSFNWTVGKYIGGTVKAALWSSYSIKVKGANTNYSDTSSSFAII